MIGWSAPVTAPDVALVYYYDTAFGAELELRGP